MRRQLLQCWRSRLLRWIEEGDVADQREPGFIGHRVGGLTRRQGLDGDGHHTQAFCIEPGRHGLRARQQRRVQRQRGHGALAIQAGIR